MTYSGAIDYNPSNMQRIEGDDPQQAIESVERSPRVHPNTYLNQYVTEYAFRYLDESGLRAEFEAGEVLVGETASLVRQGAFEHLAAMGILDREGNRYHLDPTKIPHSLPGAELVRQMADLQKRALREGKEVRDMVAPNSDLARLISYAPQCLMLSSYGNSLLKNIWSIDKGDKKYGREEEVYRVQPDNADGAGGMMRRAAGWIADRIIERFSMDMDNLGVLEFGSGNARQLVEILKRIEKGKKKPVVVASDIDIHTRPAAEKLFDDNELGDAFNWKEIDMGNPDDLRKAVALLGEKQVLILVGYIFHESRELAHRTMKAIKEVFPDAILGISEYFLQDDITDKVPLWFQTIHKMSGQQLFRYKEFLAFIAEHGYEVIDDYTIEHTRLPNGELMNATLFLRRKRALDELNEAQENLLFPQPE